MLGKAEGLTEGEALGTGVGAVDTVIPKFP